MIVVRLARRAMATLFELTLVGESAPDLRAAGESALDEIERLEEQLSLFLPTSDLSDINRRAALEPVTVERRLYRLLERAAEISVRTDGAFDIAVGPLMESRGLRGADTEALDRDRALRASGMRRVRLERGSVRLLDRRAQLDLGAIGKGYALDRAVAILRRHGVENAFLHGGWSTIRALGSPPGASGWTVGLVDPAEPETRLGSVLLRDRAFSVSASEGRQAVDGDGAAPHVVDPRDGSEPKRPVAWAAAATAAEADALSTAFLLQDDADIDGLCERFGYGAVVLEPRRLCRGLDATFFHEHRRRTGMSRRGFLRATAAAAAAFSVGLPTRAPAMQIGGNELRLGIVGVGEQGRLLLGQLVRMPGVRVQAICDVMAESTDAALAITGRNVETYEDHRHLLENEELDALVVATPTFAHTRIVLDALGDGLSVYCEAPMASSIEDCHAIAQAAAEAGTIFQVGHQRRWSRLYPHALSHLQSGSIGSLFQIRALWNRRSSWMRPPGSVERDKRVNWRLFRETSGGLLLELGSHIFDVANWLFGATPTAVAGFSDTVQWRDRRTVDDTVQVLLRYPDARQMTFEATLASSFGDDQEQIVGTEGTMLLLRQSKGLLFKEPDSVTAGWEAFAQQEMLDNRRGIVLDPEATSYVTEESGRLGGDDDRADFHAALVAFLESIRTGKAPLCGADEGRAAAVTALVALEAATNGALLTYSGSQFGS